MLRCATLFLLTIAMTGTAIGAEQAVKPHPKRSVRTILPPGLPRPHYDYRTTIVRGAAAAPPAHVEPEPLISPWVGTTPLLPGSTTIPGYYGRPFDYYYQGAYYGGPYGNGYESYFYRLPYACGVIGYC